MQSQFYTRLIKGYIEKTLTREELAIFMDLLSKGELDAYMEEDMDRAIKQQLSLEKPRKFSQVLKYAAVLVVVGLATFYLFGDKLFNTDRLLVNKVTPGSSQAVLHLSDGTKLFLDSNGNNDQRIANGLLLSRADDGALIYDFSSVDVNDKSLVNEYNSIETPKGGAYQLILSDGTKVWLNAFSKLKFPLMFSGGQRTVEVEGEVYFEVAHKPSQPFVVKTELQQIKVLGTKFNVNAYRNETVVRTTLLEGSVAVSTPLAMKTIKQGQETEVDNGGITVKEVDIDQAVAWKQGYFKFDKLKVSEMMRQVERWYNIEVVYSPQFKDERFVAKIKRTASVEELISIFNEGGLEATLNGRKLLISNAK